jgi:hypothetical protein
MNIEETIRNLRSKQAWMDSYGVKYKWISLKAEDLHWLVADWEAMHKRYDMAWGITDMSKKATHDNKGTDSAVADDAL